MQIKRQDCESCIHYEICSVKTDIDLFKNDTQKMIEEKGKTYASIVKPFRIEITCSHFIRADVFNDKDCERYIEAINASNSIPDGSFKTNKDILSGKGLKHI